MLGIPSVKDGAVQGRKRQELRAETKCRNGKFGIGDSQGISLPRIEDGESGIPA
jgi:hypothetical protein